MVSTEDSADNSNADVKDLIILGPLPPPAVPEGPIEWYSLVFWTEDNNVCSACCYTEYEMAETTRCANSEGPHRFCLQCAKANAETEIGKGKYVHGSKQANVDSY
jgi:hypothetical protein